MALPYALIIEPNESLNVPYSYLDDTFQYDRCASVENGLQLLAQKHPDLVLVSASFSLSKTHRLLDALKNKSATSLIPVIVVVDLANKSSTVLGTTWGNKYGVTTSISTVKELNAILDRVMNS